MSRLAVVAALAGFLAVAGAASAQDDAFLLGSDEYAPDFESEPVLPEGDEILLVDPSSPELEKSPDQMLAEVSGSEEPAPTPNADEGGGAAAAKPASGGKDTPGPGLWGALAALGAAALAARARRK